VTRYGNPRLTADIRLQVASKALSQGDHVVWIDCAENLPHPRLEKAMEDIDEDARDRFYRYTTPSLAHLLALVHHAKEDFPPTKTGLIVLDDVTSLFPPPASTLLQSTLLGALSKLASARQIAVLITSYVSTRVKQTGRASLVASHGSRDWDEKLSSRIVLFRDVGPHSRLRRAGILKAHGASCVENDQFSEVVAFMVTSVGRPKPWLA
jgi:hypothetical protein